MGPRIMILHIDKGRDNMLISLLMFNDQGTAFTGWGFEGGTLTGKRLKN